MSEKQLALFEWVAIQHGLQVRKYTGEPYYHHLSNVASVVNYYTHQLLLVEIAICHDLLEDTKAKRSNLLSKLIEIGYTGSEAGYILTGVVALTDVYTKEAYPNLNRMERKFNEATRLGKISPDFQTVKYADLIDNTRSIASHDKSFAKTYLAEKRVVLDLMRKGNIDLLIACCATFQSAWDSVTAKPPFE